MQLDGNVTLTEDDFDNENKIPVHISARNERPEFSQPRRKSVLKTVRRNNLILQSLHLPVVINLNPRSLYNKTTDFYDIIEQYEADVICVSESWGRENLSIEKLLNLPNHRVLISPVQRDFRGGKPVIIVNEEKFHVKPLCPDPLTVPIGVECVWALISPKQTGPQCKVKYIAVAAFYYRGPKSTKKDELFDHIAESFHLLSAKYGPDLHFLIMGDANRLNLSPITNLSPRLKQEVKVFTRLDPPAILDPIITTLGKWYQSPVSKPPIDANPGSGVKSDHLIVLMQPLFSQMQVPPREFKTVTTRPLTHAGFQRFSNFIENESWSNIYDSTDVNTMADQFQKKLLDNYYECFPTKTVKICGEDKPWITKEVKVLHRQMTREFYKNKKSKKWSELKEKFTAKCKSVKENYYEKIVADLKTSNPGKWYSKIKRMSGQDSNYNQKICVEELIGLNSKEQAEAIAEHYSTISNKFEHVQKDKFQSYFDTLQDADPPLKVEPLQVYQAIRKMNKKAATVPNDIPMKVIDEFSVEIAFPLAHIISCCLTQGVYPELWKLESVTPVPKVFPPERLKDLRRISGLPNFAKIADKLIGDMVISDMSKSRDKSQYGNEKNVSAQHYLIKLLHRVYTATDRAVQSKATAVIINMVDWSQAFDRQCHTLGVESFIRNGVRGSLIPLLVSFFQGRRMVVKFNGETSSVYPLKGGGPQGDLMGILEYLSQTNHNTDFIPSQDKFKFIDDLSFLEIIYLISQGLTIYDFQSHVPSDIALEAQFLPNENTVSQSYLNKVAEWTKKSKMELNAEKSKYMIINFTENYQFSTRLYLDSKPLEQVRETKLLGVLINDDLSWHSNTQSLVKKANSRMMILHNLASFSLPIDEMVEIYVLYIRSVVEYSAVVWHSSLTLEDSNAIERIQKIALRIILQDQYSDYQHALKSVGLQTLHERRENLCIKFATQCVRKEKMSDMFPLNKKIVNTREHERFFVQPAFTDRLKNSAIPHMQRLLNKQKFKF